MQSCNVADEVREARLSISDYDVRRSVEAEMFLLRLRDQHDIQSHCENFFVKISYSRIDNARVNFTLDIL